MTDEKKHTIECLNYKEEFDIDQCICGEKNK